MLFKHEHQPASKDDLLTWIAEFQKNPTDEIQTRLVSHYERLVITISKKFATKAEHEEDLYQVGMVGLLAALRRFDRSVGSSFESFAIPTIIGEIKRFIRDKTWSIYVPRRLKELIPKIKNAIESLTVELQRSLTIEEIAEHLKVSTQEVLWAMEVGKNYRTLSIDRSLEADQESGELTLLDLVGKKDREFERTDQQMLLEEAFEVLTERERRILHCTYFKCLSQQETGKQLGISQMHVSRLQRKALQKLRASIQVELAECL
ncbi:MAG TPA: RNA polymerase sigma factor SigB [Bacilli bacterium]|nr:RNA polymerase sigma factor SigB [Bacilli bacterium]